jgi:hypothetical protein
VAAGTLVASHVTRLRAAAAAPSLRFFTADEYALADTLCETLIPADAHSGGARAAGVAQYIDGWLAEAAGDERRTAWRDGLRQVDAVAVAEHGRRVVELGPAEQTALLQRLSVNEQEPKTPEDRFFVELKRRTVHAYYTSRVGIHEELEYKGNTLLEEFAGTDVSRRE